MLSDKHKHLKVSSGPAGCGTEAKYNLPGEPHGAYCGQHKLKDMERVNTRRCCADGCDKRASFNDPGGALPILPGSCWCCYTDASGASCAHFLGAV